MKIVIQRSLDSNVSVNNKIVGSISKGMVILVGFTKNDNIEIIDKMINKLSNLRIFDDEECIMNKSIKDVNGEILSISQFTLYANTKKGNRPSYIEALNGEEAIILYDLFNSKLRDLNIKVSTGVFGADMRLSITNDGPVTIILESRNEND